jgi:hypothetical protein
MSISPEKRHHIGKLCSSYGKGQNDTTYILPMRSMFRLCGGRCVP